MMKNTLFASIKFLLVSTVLFGGLYTLLVTGVGQVFFAHQANGSQIVEDGAVKGSELLAQPFDQAGYFQGRDQTVSQLSPYDTTQKKNVAERTATLLAENPTQTSVPIDLVTASGSGVDPDISVEAALFQLPRIADTRGIDERIIHDIINRNKVADLFSTREYVNIMTLNQQLDQLPEE
ncbi:potassium-transporting ATPase subunit C [Enterococcus casseliflavus]|uniref:potassium-transporting ATPase subunit C n=1 Tax=Enterococcus casseliflavus TaxID=37734 RepID=UPI001D9EB5FB|nr:potassium-transporting ATPase subunit C [Enterococcus sp.]